MKKLSLEDSYGTYDLYNCEGKYYAIDKVHDKNLVEEIINEKKAILGNSIKDLIKQIDSSEEWANRRGMYGLEEADVSKTLKVNSLTVYENKISKNYDVPIKVKTKEGLFVVNAKDIPNWEEKHGKNIVLRRHPTYELVNVISVDAVPELIFPYKDYNIVEYDKVYYGIPRGSGQMDLVKTNFSKVKGIKKGDLLKEVMIQIDNEKKISKYYDLILNLYINIKLRIANIVKNRYHGLVRIKSGFKIVRHDDIFYGIPDSMGIIDISDIKMQNNKKIYKSSNIENVLFDIEVHNKLLESKAENQNFKSQSLESDIKLKLDNDISDNKETFSQNNAYKEIFSHKQNIIIKTSNLYYYIPKKEWKKIKDTADIITFFSDKQNYETLFYLFSETKINDDVLFEDLVEISTVNEFTIFGFKREFIAVKSSLVDLSKMSPTEINKISINSPKFNELTSLILKFSMAKNPNLRDKNNNIGIYGDLIKTYRGYLIVLFEKVYYAISISSNLINFQTDDPFSRDDVIHDVSIYGLEELINDESK